VVDLLEVYFLFHLLLLQVLLLHLPPNLLEHQLLKVHHQLFLHHHHLMK
jgi:hypothetical protein